MSKQAKHEYEFGPFRLDRAERLLLRRDGQVVPLKGKAFDILLVLVENRGHLLEKEELMKRVWPDAFIEEANLTVYISSLRKALGEGSNGHQYIETVPKHGYRFIADVRESQEKCAEPLAQENITSGFIVQKEESGVENGSIAERQLELETDLKRVAVSSATTPATRPQSRWWANRLIWLSAVVILVVGMAVRFYLPRTPSESLTRSKSESSLPPMKVVPFTSFAGHEGSPAFSPDGKQIAFDWDGGTSDNIGIYVKLIDAGTPLRLTTHPGIDRSPTWSSDGRYIAFSRFSESEKGIFIVPALGGTERKLYSPDWGFYGFGEVVWSPDGKFLAYLDKSSRQNYGIWLLSVENLERRQLTWPAAQDLADMFPVFSADGQTLAFARWGSGGVFDIYIVPIGGGEPRRLTFDNRWISGLAWTPDGREIVFTSDRGGGDGLWRISVTGGTPERLAVGGDNDFSPPLSPQGNRLAMSRQGNRLAYVQSEFDTNIWRIEIPESKGRSNPPTKLIASTNLDQGPQYSPDGRKIVFQSSRSGSYEIWVCDSDGTNLLQLTSFGRTTGTPRWSPDGRHIAFDSRIETHSDIYVISAEGGSPRRITTETSDDVVPSWSRDGHWIYFASNRSGDNQVWKVPAEGGEAVQVTKKGGFAAFESPDGKFIHYAKGLNASGIWRIPVEGGEEAPVVDHPKLGYWGCWAVVDGGIYFINLEVKQHPVIEFFSFATGRVRQIATMEKEAVAWAPGFAVSPDGRWILYAQVDQSGGDITLVENFR